MAGMTEKLFACSTAWLAVRRLALNLIGASKPAQSSCGNTAVSDTPLRSCLTDTCGAEQPTPVFPSSHGPLPERPGAALAFSG